MKRLAAICVMLAALGMCSPTYGYVLVYDVYGTLRAVNTETNDIGRTTIQGYLVAEVDEQGNTVTGAEAVLFGRDANGDKVYVTSDTINMTLYGNNAVVVGDVGQNGGIVLTGSRTRMWQRNIGIGSRVNVANMLDGDIRVIDGAIFDLNLTLTGSGGIAAMLDLWLTRASNNAGEGLGDVIGDIISRLEARGFAAVVGEEEPPVPIAGGPMPN
jgi:hypothetical protein